MSPEILPVLNIVFSRWRETGRRISWQTLDFLREVIWRIAEPDPCGWYSSAGRKAADTPEEVLAVALAVEQLFADEAGFLSERYLTERQQDRTMETLWLEVLICVGVSRPEVVPNILNWIRQIDDQEHQARLIWVADRMLGARTSVTEYLREMAAAKRSGGVGDVCRCLLSNRNAGQYPAILMDGSGAREFYRKCPLSSILGLRDSLFYPVATAVIKEQRWDDLEVFHVIIEGLRRLFHDSGKIGFSSTLMGGTPSVAVYRLDSGTYVKPAVVGLREIDFLKAISGSEAVWRTETNLWGEFRLPQGRASFNELLLNLEGQLVTTLQLIVLLRHKARHPQ